MKTLKRFEESGHCRGCRSRHAGADRGCGACAAHQDPLNSGDTAWMITSSALVLMMTIPGLALFYGGMVRKKNVLATLAQSFGATCIITVLWMVIGYSIAFTPNPDAGMNKYIGGFDHLFLGR